MFNLFKKKQKVITRIAPSPTGIMHIGTARTALFNFLYTKKFNGKFILRIEDTDKERSTKEFEKDILESMKWLGLDWDEFYRQSERTENYKKALEKIIENGSAYISQEESGDRKEVIRFKNPNKIIAFKDELRGEIKFDTTELGDFVIAKSVTEPLYHFAVVLDDFEMGITHIIRGDDGISNTPRQILIQEAIGAPRPIYIHLPLILSKDKSKMSKRHGATAVSEFKNEGYLKEAILNFIAFLGWNPGDDREIFNINELIKEFEISKLSKSGAVFNEEKLNWFNQQYLRKELNSDEKFIEYFKQYQSKIDKDTLLQIKELILERICNLKDFEKFLEEGEFDFILKEPKYLIEKIIWKDDGAENATKHLKSIRDILSKLDAEKKYSAEEIKNLLWDYACEHGKGNVLWPLRYSLSGKDKSPDPFILISILGYNKTIQRIDYAISKLEK
jgi:glutamyl-tRNA synthetase